MVAKAKKTDKKEAVKQNLKAYQEKARTEIKKARAKFLKHEKKVNEYIKNNPKKAVAMAVGVGAALGALSALLTRKKK